MESFITVVIIASYIRCIFSAVNGFLSGEDSYFVASFLECCLGTWGVTTLI